MAGLAAGGKPEPYLAALRYQSGADFGLDAQAWQAWSRLTIRDRADRARELIRLGDPAGFLYCGVWPKMSREERTALLRRLTAQPRCVLRLAANSV